MEHASSNTHIYNSVLNTNVKSTFLSLISWTGGILQARIHREGLESFRHHSSSSKSNGIVFQNAVYTQFLSST